MQEEPAGRTRQGRHPACPSVLTPFPRPAPARKASSRWPRHNLPAQATPLIGREPEVAAVRQQLLRPDVRLLTLTGAGGSGKTRLALEVAAGLLDTFANGVFFVDLSSIRDPALVVPAIARPLGVREAGGRPLFETLKQYLRRRRVLLVLDNVEHVLPAAVEVAELLAACPEVKALATSRAPLHVCWEHELVLAPLPVPDLPQLPTPGVLAHNPAVGLFVQRAQAVRANFCLTTETAQSVAEICVRLDGLPLALELAAARVKVLAPAALLERLQHRFELLVGGPQDQAARHQTLRAAVDWSYGLLHEAERVLFRRLAVFAGGFTLEAAEAVCAGEGLQAGAVLEGLARLADWSLVLAEECGGEMRYRLLETIREYALEQAVGNGRLTVVQDGHARYFLALAEQAEARLQGPEQTQWLRRLDVEHDNLRAALQHLLDSTERELGLRLAGALWEFWWIRGYLGEGQRWLEAALAGSTSRTAARARALNRAGALATLRGDFERALRHFDEGVSLARALGDRVELSRALCHLGTDLLWTGGDRARGLALLGEGLALAQESGYAWGTAYALFLLGVAASLVGERDQAQLRLEECLGVYRSLGETRGTAYSLVTLSDVAYPDAERLRLLSSEALGLFHEVGDTWGVSWALLALGVAASLRREHGRAARVFGALEALREAIGAGPPPPLPQSAAAYPRAVETARRVLDADGFAAAWAAGRAMPLGEAVAYALQTDEPSRPAASGKATASSLDVLTPREREVAGFVARGLTNRQIAERLVVSERTVDSHVEHIRSKLGLRSRSHLGAWAGAHGLGSA